MFKGVQVILTHANGSQRPISDKFDVFRNATSKFRVKFKQRAPYRPRNVTLHSNLCLSNSSVHSLLIFEDNLLLVRIWLSYKCCATNVTPATHSVIYCFSFAIPTFFFCGLSFLSLSTFLKVDKGKKCSCLLHYTFFYLLQMLQKHNYVFLNMNYPSVIKQIQPL